MQSPLSAPQVTPRSPLQACIDYYWEFVLLQIATIFLRVDPCDVKGMGTRIIAALYGLDKAVRHDRRSCDPPVAGGGDYGREYEEPAERETGTHGSIVAYWCEFSAIKEDWSIVDANSEFGRDAGWRDEEELGVLCEVARRPDFNTSFTVNEVVPVVRQDAGFEWCELSVAGDPTAWTAHFIGGAILAGGDQG
jgi:hypothetical protein